MIAFVGLGGNLGGPAAVAARFAEALAEIERLPFVRQLRVSSLYTSAPIGPVAGQPAFLNAVCGIALLDGTEPRQLHAALRAIESALGRDRAREVAQGPRAIDLDLLLHGERIIDEADLVVPHPRLHRRAFALVPLAELAGPDLIIPTRGVTVGDCLRDPEVAGQAIAPSDLVFLPPE